jgi:hypothetical protein
VGQLVEAWPENWHRSRLFRVLSLGGYIGFDPPKVVSWLGALLLLCIATTHMYILIGQEVVYALAVSAGCLSAAASIGFGRNARVARAGWYLGDLLAAILVGVAVGTRVTGLPDLAAVTGRWDFAPATLALAFAVAFVALHASVQAGINIAYPQRQHWAD